MRWNGVPDVIPDQVASVLWVPVTPSKTGHLPLSGAFLDQGNTIKILQQDLVKSQKREGVIFSFKALFFLDVIFQWDRRC